MFRLGAPYRTPAPSEPSGAVRAFAHDATGDLFVTSLLLVAGAIPVAFALIKGVFGVEPSLGLLMSGFAARELLRR